MVRKYTRKTQQASWDENTMKKAIQEVLELKHSVKSTAAKHGIPRATLQRHLKTGSYRKRLGRFTVFTPEQELELVELAIQMDNMLHTLTRDEFLQLVYQYAEKNDIPHPFRNGSAKLYWYNGFITRHPDLILKKPEKTSNIHTLGHTDVENIESQ